MALFSGLHYAPTKSENNVTLWYYVEELEGRTDNEVSGGNLILIWQEQTGSVSKTVVLLHYCTCTICQVVYAEATHKKRERTLYFDVAQ